MAFRFPRLRKENTFVALHIGTETVRAFFCARNAEGTIAVRGKAVEHADPFRTWVPELQNLTREEDFQKKMMRLAIRNALEKLPLPRGRIARPKMFVTFSPFFLRARTHEILWERQDRRVPISSEEERVISRNAVREVQAAAERDMAEKYGLPAKDIFFLHTSIAGIRIDGYKVASFRGFHGKKVEVFSFTTFLPRLLVNNRSGFPAVLAGIADGPRSSYDFAGVFHFAQLFGKLPFLPQDAVFLHIGEKYTQVCVRKQGTPVLISEFEGGAGGFTKALSDHFDLDGIRAMEMKERYARGEFSRPVEEGLRERFAPLLASWRWKLQEMLEDQKYGIPSAFVLFGEGAGIPGFQESVSQDSWGGTFAGEKRASILSPDDMPGIDVSQLGEKLTPQDVPALLLYYAS